MKMDIIYKRVVAFKSSAESSFFWLRVLSLRDPHRRLSMVSQLCWELIAESVRTESSLD